MFGIKNQCFFNVSLTIIIFVVISFVETKLYDQGRGIISLINDLNEKIIKNNDYKEDVQKSASNLLELIKKELIKIGKDYLIEIFKDEEWWYTHQYRLIEDIFHYDTEIFIESYKAFIDEAPQDQKEHKIGELIRYTKISNSTELVIHAYSTIFSEMQINKLLNSAEIFNLAHHLHKIKRMSTYNKLTDKLKSIVKNLLNGVPVCLKNILHSNTTVEIKNVGKNEHLVAGAFGYFFEKDNRIVYTSAGSHHGEWKFTHMKQGIYHIMNTPFDEYLFSSKSKYNETDRYVFTWRPGGVPNRSKFKIILAHGHCLIKNVEFNEYLYATDLEPNTERGNVFTIINSHAHNNDHYYWTIHSN